MELDSLNPEIPLRVRLGRTIKQSRLSQAEVGRRIGEDRDWVNNRVLGKVQIQAEDMAKFAKALGVSVAVLYGEDSIAPMRLSAGRSPLLRTFMDTYEQVRSRLPLHNQQAADMVLALLDHELAQAM